MKQRRRTRRAVLVLVMACGVLMSAVSFASAQETVSVCGTLTSLSQPTPSSNVGSATVGGKTYYLSGTPGPNQLSPQATVGSNVCLSGQLAATDTGPTPMLIRWTIALAPVPSATSAATAPSTRTLPSTNTSSNGDSLAPLLIGLVALGAIAMLAILVARRVSSPRS